VVDVESKRSFFPISIAGRVIIAMSIFVMLIVPGYSKFISYRYVFSWSMYNGAWVPEEYRLSFLSPSRQIILTRNELAFRYGIRPLPYGKNSLLEICRTVPGLDSIERIGKFDAIQSCQ
jgi:hypothetical protein